MITITPGARTKIVELMAAESAGSPEKPGSDATLALRIEVLGRGPGGFQYDLQFVEADEPEAEVEAQDADGIRLHIHSKSLDDLAGATLDWVERPFQSGFKIENPNPIFRDPLAQAVQQVIDEKINPAVAGHGGFITLLDVREETAFVALGGGCQGCGMADVTLKQGIEVMIREAVPAITRIIDTTDHAGGANPFYQPSKGGSSPIA